MMLKMDRPTDRGIERRTTIIMGRRWKKLFVGLCLLGLVGLSLFMNNPGKFDTVGAFESLAFRSFVPRQQQQQQQQQAQELAFQTAFENVNDFILVSCEPRD